MELMAGECIISCGWRLHRVPTAVPWELKNSKHLDVLLYWRELSDLALQAYVCLAWLGTVCKTYTLARLPRLRSALMPWGLYGLRVDEQHKVSEGNCLALFSVLLAACLYQVQAYFIIENPKLSLLWLLQPFMQLHMLQGVGFVETTFRAH